MAATVTTTAVNAATALSTGQDGSSSIPATTKTTSTSKTPTMVEVPLTTIFTPPASCDDLMYTLWINSGSTTYWKNAFTLSSVPGASCYPSSFWLRQATGTTMEYSPGVCPTGYHAAQIIQSGSSAAATSFCCPSGMAYSAGAGCYSMVRTSTNIIRDIYTTVAITTPITVWDWHIQAVWKSADLNAFTPASAPLLTSGAASVTVLRSADGGTQAPDASQTSATVNNGTSGGNTSTSSAAAASNTQASLSGGAIAGIVIGAVVGVLALLALVFFLLRRRRRQQKPHQQAAPPYTADAKVAPDQHAYTPVAQQGPNELPAMAANEHRPELAGGAHGTTAELHAHATPAELDGHYYSPRDAKAPIAS